MATEQITEYRPPSRLLSQEQRDAIYAQINDLLGNDDSAASESLTPTVKPTPRVAMLVAGVILPPLLAFLPRILWGHGSSWFDIAAGFVAGVWFCQIWMPFGLGGKPTGKR
jgi:hypothetical protein